MAKSVRLVSTAFLGMCTVSLAFANGPTEVSTSKQKTVNMGEIQFIEYPGEMEFSGTMIARPISIETWQSKGLSVTNAEMKYDSAVKLIESGFSLIRHVPQTDQYIFVVPAGMTENDVANNLMSTGLFKFAEPNWTVYPAECPNDPRLNQQWHHNANIMDSCAGWDIHTGNSTTSVGICDTGVRYTHEDLQLHRLEGYNAVDRKWESDGGQINDIYGHGTDTTGCAAANGNNGIGVSGVGWNLSHRMLRVTNSSGGGSSLEWLNHAAMTAIESGDKVASLSYSGVDNQSVLDTATYIKSIGGLMVWAAGNYGQNLNLNDRDADDVIAVGATDINDNKASWSNYGRFVDLVAPGVDVYTLSYSGDTSYHATSGTSFACPLTAGLVALIWSADPSLTPDEVENILKTTCDDLGSSGIDNTYGYGRINVNNAMQAIGGGSTDIVLSTGNLVGGQYTIIDVTNATPNKNVYVVYSLKGTGSTYVAALDVTLGLSSPKLATTMMADGSGNASTSSLVPAAGSGSHVWIQAAQYQRVSNVVDDIIQ